MAILVGLWVARVNLAFGPQPAPRPSDAVSLPDARVLPAFTPAPILATGQGPGPFTAFRDCAACLEMVALPGGTFTMGSSANEPGQDEDEGAVSVSLPAFAISRFPVTSGQYMAFAAATWRSKAESCDWRTPGFKQPYNHPAVCVSWEDAVAYARWMSRKTGQTYRLLSEAEYEYANRAGTTTAYFWGSEAAAGCDYANMAAAVACGHRDHEISPVGSFSPNPWGLFDTTGNVWSWTADCYALSYDANPRTGAPSTGGDCNLRVVRGGAWFISSDGLRSAFRNRNDRLGRYTGTGFRLARDLSPATP